MRWFELNLEILQILLVSSNHQSLIEARAEAGVFKVCGCVSPLNAAAVAGGFQGYEKRLRELFVTAGYQTSADQWRRQSDAVVHAEQRQRHQTGHFDTIYECRAVSSSVPPVCRLLSWTGFPIPSFGIEKFLILGSRRDYAICPFTNIALHSDSDGPVGRWLVSATQ